MSSSGAAITGFGAVTPLGLTVSQTWEGLCSGRVGINTITAYDPAGFSCQIAGQVPDYNIREFIPKAIRKSAKLMSRDIELTVIAAHEALTHSGLVTKGINPENINVDPQRMAINTGAGLISCDLVELAPAVAASITEGKFDIKKWGKEGIEHVTPLWLLKYLPNMLACHVGIIHDIQGPSNTITCAEAGAQLAITEAAQVISRGAADIALAGGTEAKVNPIVMIRQCLINRATIQNNDDPSTACRPFDADAKGSVFGEAAGILVLENAEKAKHRKAEIYAELIGTGNSNSINRGYTHLEADGRGLQTAIEKAIAEANISPEQLDLIIPHGTGIPVDDMVEAKAIETALGKAASQISVWPIKSMISNTGAAAGAIDVIAALCAMKYNTIPAAKNCENIAKGCNLNIVRELQEKEINYALCCSYTYGGQTAAVILKKP